MFSECRDCTAKGKPERPGWVWEVKEQEVIASIAGDPLHVHVPQRLDRLCLPEYCTA